MSLSIARRLTRGGVLSQSAISPARYLMRSSISSRLSSNNAPQSSSSSRRPSPAPQNDRSQFKVLPIVIIMAIGSGSYALLVKSRTGQAPQRQT
ncbi:hypothetical protein POX_c04322 [Penicillium oxalicum]|uniref:Uncharacterized protein n=1 Tax=Penicillium oxalicum (strain 114-2 / CGMCC 5302) TaxID=933388 RepID=S8AVP6_PENO1|nr:hypothetical protein POX_c04322 [Penicillium oxalicum]EPS25947.1 hypothetical protein PDE_00883 [Penicillium oxalicum 114-2]KAI2791461.1 hypothetical protein POX_c04322 [Penicillium oxalicum]